MLTIKNGDRSFQVNKQEACRLELKLNISKYGHEWSHIGDILYKFSIGGGISVIPMSNEQYDYFLSIK